MKYCIVCLLFLYSCTGSAQMEKVDKKAAEKATLIEAPQLIEQVEKVDSQLSEKSDSTKLAETLPFELIEFNSQQFSGGAPGSNTIFMYQAKLTKLTDKRLSFKAFWLSSSSLSIDFQLKRKFQTDDWTNYKADDEVLLFAQKTNYGEAAKEAMKNSKTIIEKGKEAPYKFESEGLLEYELDGKTYYHEIEVITALPSVNAP